MLDSVNEISVGYSGQARVIEILKPRGLCLQRCCLWNRPVLPRDICADGEIRQNPVSVIQSDPKLRRPDQRGFPFVVPFAALIAATIPSGVSCRSNSTFCAGLLPLVIANVKPTPRLTPVF
ncbi:MAG: hypothetical protein CM15mP74_10960 [Halieaceae bacterium]|nr:MAG: hypothetical protein CM15mP74_10960 [Halieaceae bacterium]